MDDTGHTASTAELADRLAIHDVLAVHCRGVDRADEQALKSAYWPDAEVAYGGFEGSAHEFCARLPQAIRRFRHTQHSISNVLIRLTGHEAAVETYVTAYHYLASDNTTTSDSEMIFLGRYLDRMQKRNNVWKIKHRQVLMDWNQNVSGSAIWTGPPFDGLARGDRQPDDPSYALFAPHTSSGATTN